MQWRKSEDLFIIENVRDWRRGGIARSEGMQNCAARRTMAA